MDFSDTVSLLAFLALAAPSNPLAYAAVPGEPSLREDAVFSNAGGFLCFRISARPEEGNWPRVPITADASGEGFAMAASGGDTDLDIAVIPRDTYPYLRAWRNDAVKESAP